MCTPNITFGIELEFIALRPDHLFDGIRVPEYSDPGAGAAIFRALKARGLRATGWETDDEVENAPTHSRWRVESDELFLSDNEAELLPDGWSAEAIEISSRKFHFYLDEWRDEVAKVLNVLREVGNKGCRFITNKSTGFHVHIGNNAQRIPLRTAKNVFQLFTAFERCFDELHTTSRIFVPEGKDFGRPYYPAYPPSFFHMFGDAWDASKGFKSSPLLERLANIEELDSYEELSAFFTLIAPDFGIEYETSGHCSSVNYDNLVRPRFNGEEEACTGTIEFRQHTGTLDYLDIVAWVTTLVQVVNFASSSKASDFLDLIIRGVDTDFKLPDLLNAMGIHEQVIDHYLQGAVIGIISEENSHLSGNPTYTSVDQLIAQNDSECEERSDRAAVEATIDRKFQSGMYGINPDQRTINLPRSVAAAELQKALVTVHMSGADVSTEEGIAFAREKVLKQFAYFHSLGTTDFSRGM